MITMLTVVPTSLAMDLCKKKRVRDYNTLPQLHPAIVDAVREFMTNNVGYSELPMACLDIRPSDGDTGADVFSYIPTNSKENVLFQLEMPDDMIVSVDYQTLLNASNDAKEMESIPGELDLIKEELQDNLIIGELPTSKEVISFIPFLEYSRCKLYARFNNNFEPVELDLPGLEKMPLAKLSAFMD